MKQRRSPFVFFGGALFVMALSAFGTEVFGTGVFGPRVAFAEEAHDVHDEHEAHGEAGGHAGDGHHEEHELNWHYGLLGVGEEGDEPTLLFRPPSMPVPVLAMAVNSLILFGGFYFLGRKAVAEGLKNRRERILKGMDDAGKMHKEARAQLKMYQDKLEQIEAEVERMKQEMRDAAEAERAQLLAEARARRERMERDAKLLIEQELKAAHEELLKETAKSAVESAERFLREQVSADDQSRLERDYLASLKGQLGAFTKGAA